MQLDAGDVYMGGYGVWKFRGRPQGVHDLIWARAFVLSANGTTIATAVLDLPGISNRALNVRPLEPGLPWLFVPLVQPSSTVWGGHFAACEGEIGGAACTYTSRTHPPSRAESAPHLLHRLLARPLLPDGAHQRLSLSGSLFLSFLRFHLPYIFSLVLISGLTRVLSLVLYPLITRTGDP